MNLAAVAGVDTIGSFQFGDTPQLADRLASLVIAGRKTASCWAAISDDKVTDPGQRWIALNGANTPVAVIETVSLTRLPFPAVTPDMAALEGEGDLSHAFWADAHEDYFRREGTWSSDMDLHFEVLRLVEVLDERFALNAHAAVAAEISEAAARGFNAPQGARP